MRLATLALAHKGWLSEQPFGDGPSWHPLLGVAEEVGELCHAHLKAQQNIRGSAEDLRAQQEDAVGDIVIYLVDYCNREGLDIESCIQNAWAEVSHRDWRESKEKPCTRPYSVPDYALWTGDGSFTCTGL